MSEALWTAILTSIVGPSIILLMTLGLRRLDRVLSELARRTNDLDSGQLAIHTELVSVKEAVEKVNHRQDTYHWIRRRIAGRPNPREREVKT
jgi:hypothetical protein